MTIRARLTLLYTGLFLACGAGIVVILYGLVAALPAAGTAVTEEDLAQYRTYAACMRAAGVDMSPPDETGNMKIRGQLAEVNRAELESDPVYKAAVTACEPQLPDQEQRIRECESATSDDGSAADCKAVWREAGAAGAIVQRDATLAHLLRYSLIALAAGTLLAVGAGWLVAGRALRPVHRITEAAREASEHNLSARVSLRGPRDELGELADTFDGMLDRLQASFESQGRFIANAGHELRTPLTVMRTALDVVLSRSTATAAELRLMGRDVLSAVNDAERRINTLLTLSRSEHGRITRQPVDLATLAEDAVDAAHLGRLRLHASLQSAMTSGDQVLLESLVTNLLDNAIRHNVGHGEIWIATSTVDGHAALDVANTGPAIADDAVPSLFEPFHRLEERTSQAGFGLGLAIVASITTAHHGAITARARPGGGLAVTVTLPSTPDDEHGDFRSGDGAAEVAGQDVAQARSAWPMAWDTTHATR